MLVPFVQERPHNNLMPRLQASLPYRPQRYPTALYHPDGRDLLVNSEDEEKSALAQGFSTALPPKPASSAIEIMNHPQSVAEQSAMQEMKRKFDASYGLLLQRYQALETENAELRAQVDTKADRGSKKQAHAPDSNS